MIASPHAAVPRAILEVCCLEKTYDAAMRPVAALRGVSFAIEKGSFCAVLGPSGSGKSTLMNIIGLLDRPTAGSVRLADETIDYDSADAAAHLRNRLLGFVFQSFNLLPRLTAWENVALPLLYRGMPRDERKPIALAMLGQVGLEDRAEHRPAALSGGQQQRVALARALVANPALVLADEPTGSLDSITAGDVMALLRDLNRRLGVSVLMVTHDRDLAARCDRRIEMLDGRIVADVVAS
jgi:putative ABC transport system ATP-binding protein